MSAPASPLHLVGRFNDPYTGAERRLLELARRVAARRAVRLWSDVFPHRWHAQQGVRPIQPFAQQFPKGGLLLLAGVHVQTGLWLRHVHPDRVVLLYNLPSPERLFSAIELLRESTGCEPEIVFASHSAQQAVGLPGIVEPSWLDLSAFLSIPLLRPDTRPFTIGRMSRDVIGKHHADDVALYRMLAARGVRVRIMGGRCLAGPLAGVAGIELLPTGAEEASAFYGSLDAVFYRTGAFAEAYGRVVIEAMAAGLPVVAGAEGGYVDALEHGRSGILVQTQEQAWNALMHLAAHPGLRQQMGEAARRRAVAVHGEDAAEGLLSFYLR
ncbi:glycosyltransferase [Variovorax terrae]|uniref:Glycosyltransferase n=1 Tax=Variovorax terrae TaxID=2923278 RepID=A0A9X1VUN3_9BURK|nr:glycosyltransferase [Variovorax terrae]MCJ0763588.1 glycosyltransferase [Variovorax terrae]